jgi:hypothetical protein
VGSFSGYELVGGLVGHLYSKNSSSGSIANSFRYTGITVTANDTISMDNNTSGLHGGIATAAEFITQITYANNGWPFSSAAWHWDDRNFPKLNIGTETYPFPFAVPTITGQSSMELVEGYVTTTTGAYAITGTHSPKVTKSSGNAAITWNDTDYTLEIATGLMHGEYPVLLSVNNGIFPDVTYTFTLKVEKPIITIDAQPQSIGVTIGKISEILSVSASVTPNTALSYQWFSNTTDSNSGGTAIPNATSADFSIPANLTTNAYYYCTVSASTTSVSSNTAEITAKKTLPLLSLTISPDKQIKPLTFITLTASLTGAFPDNSDKPIILSLNGSELFASTDASGTAVCVVSVPITKTYNIGASFAGNIENEATSAESIVMASKKIDGCSGSCNAGYGYFALALIAVLLILRKKE